MVFRRRPGRRQRPDADADESLGEDAWAAPPSAPADATRATEAAGSPALADVAGHGGREIAASGVPASLNGARPDRGARPLGAVILAVDDEPSIRAFVHKALRRAGHEVTVARGGEEALSILERLTFDVLLLDHRMSGMDGIELYRRAVEIRPELRNRTILMSGDVVSPALLEFGQSEGVRLLGKPFDIDSLTATLDEVIGQA